jgi:hypothetical protein
MLPILINTEGRMMASSHTGSSMGDSISHACLTADKDQNLARRTGQFHKGLCSGLCQHLPHAGISNQNARPRHRCERDRRLKLRLQAIQNCAMEIDMQPQLSRGDKAVHIVHLQYAQS